MNDRRVGIERAGASLMDALSVFGDSMNRFGEMFVTCVDLSFIQFFSSKDLAVLTSEINAELCPEYEMAYVRAFCCDDEPEEDCED